MTTGVTQDRSPMAVSAAGWLFPALLTGLALAGLVLLFRQTFLGMASTWWHSSTYSYGLIVPPIALFLAWERRHALARVAPRSDWRVVPLLLVAGCLWLLANLLDQPWLGQAGAIALLALTVRAVLGRSVFRILLLPLGLLFLAIPPVPLHDALLRPLMDVTGDIAATLLGWSGIPYQRDGDIIALASGRWSVEKVCSGVRFFFSSAVLGILFASRAFRSWRRRLPFIAFALVLPILANGVRVYITILVGHLEGVAEAVAVDHTVYGGLFAGLVLTIMFVVGAFWWERDAGTPAAPHPRPSIPERDRPASSNTVTIFTALACLSAAAVWPAFADLIDEPSPQRAMLHLDPPREVDGWRHDRQRPWAWWPRVGRVDAEFYRFYRKDGAAVALYVGQSQGRQASSDLTDPRNVMIVKQHSDWRSHRRQQSRSLARQGDTLAVVQNRITVPGFGEPTWHKLVVWHWYRIGGRYTDNPHLARLLGLWSSLIEDRSDASLIVVATPYTKAPEQGDAVLQAFVASVLPEIEARLERSRKQSAARGLAAPR